MSQGVRLDPEELRVTYDEVVAAGSQKAVAVAHGWNQAKVRHRVLAWMRHAGIEGDPPGIISPSHRIRGALSHAGTGDRTAVRLAQRDADALRARLATVEAEHAALRAEHERLADLHVRFDRLEAMVAQVLARPAGIVSHRRQSDGGIGGREELRQLRRPA
jgi:hypothetical protein